MAGIKINSEKLRRELTSRGLNAGLVSYEMGHGRNYFSDSFRRGTLSRHAVVYLENKYNIKLKDYQAEFEKENNKDQQFQKEVLFSEMTNKQVYQLMYSAFYHACKKAWSE